MDEFSDLEESSNVGKIIGMVILLLAILGAIGYYLYNKFYINKPVIDDKETVVSNKIDDEKDDIYYIDYTKYEISYTDKGGEVVNKVIDIKYPVFNNKSDEIAEYNDEIRDLVKILNNYYQNIEIKEEGIYNLSLNGVSTYFDEYCYYEFVTGRNDDLLSLGIISHAVSGDKEVSKVVGAFNIDTKNGTKVDNELFLDMNYFNSENVVKDFNNKHKLNVKLEDLNIFLDDKLVNITYNDTNTSSKYLTYTLDGELTESIVKNN